MMVFFIFHVRDFFFGMMVTMMVMNGGKVFCFPKKVRQFILYER